VSCCLLSREVIVRKKGNFQLNPIRQMAAIMDKST
jgi:hypothetical protein